MSDDQTSAQNQALGGTAVNLPIFDTGRHYALDAAIRSSSVDAAAEQVVAKAEAFHAFLTAGTQAQTPSAPRGRPRKTTSSVSAETPAASTTEAPPPQTATAAASPATTATAAAAEDDFLAEPKAAPVEEKKYTLPDVRAALVALQTAKGQAASIKVLKDYGGVEKENFGKLDPAKFAAVIEAAQKATK